MHGDIIKGSDEEIKHKAEHTKIPLEIIEDNIKHLRYTIFDLKLTHTRKYNEDGSVLLHQLMHVEADIVNVSYNHIYIYMCI